MHTTTGYSHAAKAGSLVFVAGQVALDAEGNVVGRGDIEAQTVQGRGRLPLTQLARQHRAPNTDAENSG